MSKKKCRMVWAKGDAGKVSVILSPLWFLEVRFYIRIKCFDTNVSEAPFCDMLSRIRINILGSKLIQRRTERKMNFKARTLLTFSVKIFSAPRLNLSFKVALFCVDESYLNRHIHHNNFSATPHSNRSTQDLRGRLWSHAGQRLGVNWKLWTGTQTALYRANPWFWTSGELNSTTLN